MKQFILTFLLFPFFTFSQTKTHVKGYVKKNGTIVEQHNRTNKNKTERDNWSSKPNHNPETGKKGTKTPKK